MTLNIDAAVSLRNRLCVILAELNWSAGLVRDGAAAEAFVDYQRAVASAMADVSERLMIIFSEFPDLELPSESWNRLVADLVAASPPPSRSHQTLGARLRAIQRFVSSELEAMDVFVAGPVMVAEVRRNLQELESVIARVSPEP